MTAYIGLGSNLGDRRANLKLGLEGLRACGLELEAVSSVWESEPVGSPEPLWYLNMAVAAVARRPPLEILDCLLAIERRAGRARTGLNAPRTLDLDLLMVDGLEVESPRLELPHPRMWKRRFVLEPLAEIAPELRNPRTGRTVAQECGRIRDGMVFRIGELATCSGVTL